MSIAALCCRCWRSLEQPAFRVNQKRFRHASASLDALERLSKPPPRKPRSRVEPLRIAPHAFGPTTRDEIPHFFVRNVRHWSLHPRCHARLRNFGIPYPRLLLKEFAAAVARGELHETQKHWEKYGLARFGHGLRELSIELAEKEADIIYSTIFFTWASEPQQQKYLAELLHRNTPLSVEDSVEAVSRVRRLSQVASRQHPAEEFPPARQMRRRIIMHVGPTNSGKTHHALRALASASRGVYAGPLRLLAHEIWERLNLGEITPLGVDDAAPQPHTSGTLPDYFQNHPNLLRAFNLSTRSNLAHVRPCNLITGEEQKIVSESAPLVSSTVEMVSMLKYYDVAVVDEIQMISDQQRGAAWTSAVLGLCAREIHLCGEETAVPIVRALLEETGDEIEIRRYERLTPLEVEKQSLKGSYSGVAKGDCVVAFSRSGIFGIKNQIEARTGMKCAVVYGKLPPEVRSEQARLFNDPDSGYDIIIGSDAIGMGLNLKIRRVIFDATAKRSQDGMEALSTSQVKQIAGRAGRYGLLHPESKHNTPNPSSPGGSVTALDYFDLPFIRKALSTPNQPLCYARLGIRLETFTALVHTLPAGASTLTVYEAHVYAGSIGNNYRYAMPSHDELKKMCELVDGEVKGQTKGKVASEFTQLDLEETHSLRNLTIDERSLFCLAPVPWRDAVSLKVMTRLLEMYRKSLKVDLSAAVEGQGFMEAVEGMESFEAASDEKKPSKRRPLKRGLKEVGNFNQQTLILLENFHRVIGLYLWMSYRNPASWVNRDEVIELKLRVEHALERCLEGLSRKANDDRILKRSRLNENSGGLGRPYLKKLAFGY